MYTKDNQTDDSKLKALRTEGGFTVPLNYFENMRKQILTQTNSSEKDDHFLIPEGYFEKSKETILDQTTRKHLTVRVWYKQSYVKYAAAAMVLVLSSFAFNLYFNSRQAHLQSMSDEEIIMYLEEEGTRDISLTDVSFVLNSSVSNSIDSDALNTIDEQSLIEEL